VRAVYQCTRVACGKLLSSAPVLGHEMDPMDLPRFEVKRKAQPNSKRRAYNTVLHSPAWARLRQRVFARSKGLCEMKLWGCTGKATALHHEIYEDDLAAQIESAKVDLKQFKAACRGCNLLERERRITSRVLGTPQLAGPQPARSGTSFVVGKDGTLTTVEIGLYNSGAGAPQEG
jgi:hypothetical protein